MQEILTDLPVKITGKAITDLPVLTFLSNKLRDETFEDHHGVKII